MQIAAASVLERSSSAMHLMRELDVRDVERRHVVRRLAAKRDQCLQVADRQKSLVAKMAVGGGRFRVMEQQAAREMAAVDATFVLGRRQLATGDVCAWRDAQTD